MTITNGYCTRSELQDALRRPSTDIDNGVYDDLFDRVIEDASRDIDSYTNQIFFSSTLSNEIVDVYGFSENGLYINSLGNNIFVPGRIISVSEIIEDSVNLVEDTDYYIYGRQRKVESAGYWSTERKSISISLAYGFPDVPNDIRNICIELAKTYSGLDTRVITTDDGNIKADTGRSIPRHIKYKLNKWRVAYA